MKIYLTKPRNHWLAPYTIFEKVLFWKDWENISYRTPWVKKWSDRLSPFCVALSNFLDFVHPQVKYVKIDYWDTWSMDYTLSPIIPPMLKQLKETKHGSGFIDMEDVPEYLRTTTTEDYEEQQTFDFYKENVPEGGDIHARYDWVLDEMIWAFEQLNNPDHEEQFWKQRPEFDLDEYPEDEGENIVPLRWKVEGQCDWEGLRKHQDRIQNGCRLFGKNYQTLWD
mgnify:CR=1 FL=1